MASEVQQPIVAQGSLTDYALHTLGWKSFQDLCVAVAQERLNRPIEYYLPSRDGGRDGAFVGRWDDKVANGKSTIQCKFTSKTNASLTIAGVKSELAKVERLAAQNLAEDYILMTNYGVSGESAGEIVAAFEAAGVKTCQLLGRDWITQQIRESSRLRVMVPRVYGLGDLSEILDERAYEQSQALLSALGDDLACFVITDAHRKSVEALLNHSFVLLLGDPASGKSTIAASLALGALDHWQARTIRLTNPDDFQRHWNPNSPKQFFWVDDAFGATQYQRHITDAWNRQLPMMSAALRKGARFLLTSRTYIWRSAHRDLKTTSFPLFDRSQVVIDVQGLAESEKAQILYNHIKRGDQTKRFKMTIKPHLAALAGEEKFLPETARRLGWSFFTDSVDVSREGLLDFVRRPVEFLRDVLRNLDSGEAAAVALVFMHGGRLASPIEVDERIRLVTELLGVSAAGIRLALDSLRGSLVLLVETPDGPTWTFKHPTVGDAYAALVAESPELTEIYLRGAKFERLLEEVVCGDVHLKGASVRVGSPLYPALLERFLERPFNYQVGYFLGQRADDTFLKMYVERRPGILDMSPTVFMAYSSENRVLARLNDAGVLPEDKRSKLIEKIIENTIEHQDGGALRDDALRSIFTNHEFRDLIHRIKLEVLDDFSSHVADWKYNCSDDDPDSHFDELNIFLDDVEEALSEDDPTRSKIALGRSAISDAIDEINDSRDPDEDFTIDTPSSTPTSEQSAIAAIFDDVDE